MATLPCSVSFSFLLLSSLVPLPPKQPCRGQYPFHHNPSLKSVRRLLGAACLHWQTDSYGLERLPQETQKSHPPAKYLSLFVALTDIWEILNGNVKPCLEYLSFVGNECQKWLCVGLVTIKRNLREWNDNWLLLCESCSNTALFKHIDWLGKLDIYFFIFIYFFGHLFLTMGVNKKWNKLPSHREVMLL